MSKYGEIEDTSKRDPLTHLAGGLIEGDDYILNMEKNGQTHFVHSAKMPTDLGRDGKEPYEALGFTFGDVVEGDPLFMEATLPEGWERQPTDHSMWSQIVDERGIRRVAIFYKAAFYDRSAHANILKPGVELANTYLYGKDIPSLDVLTEEERADFVTELDRMDENIEKYPDIYGEYRDRLKEARKLVADG